MPSPSSAANHFELLVGWLPDTNYFAKDLHGRFVQADQGFVEMLGCRTREQILGRTDFDFFPREIAEKFVADDNRVLSTGQPLVHHAELVPNPDMTFSSWLVNKAPMRNRQGNILGIAGIITRVSPAGAPSLYGSSMFAVLESIGRHYAEPLPVARLAKLAGLSVRAFERHFSATFGTTPSRYVNHVRLQAVRQFLIRTGKPLAEIAVECGFYDQSHMTAMFRKHFGCSPRRYRVSHVSAPIPD